MLYRVIMPLFNFQSDAEKIELDKGLFIRKIGLKEVEMLQHGKMLQIINEFEKQLIFYALETEIYGLTDSEFNEVNDLFEKVILSLRLFKSGDIHSKVTFYKRENGGVRAYWKAKAIPPHVLTSFYRLTKGEVDKFVVLLNKIKSLKLTNRQDLNIVLHRFNKSYDDPLEEALIDTMIALESLVLWKGRNEGRSNIKEKIAVGASMLIGRTFVEKRMIRLRIEKAYETRNEIVHGIKYKVGKKEAELYHHVKEYLRRAIIKMLD